MVDDKLCNFIALQRSPSQSQDQFESFKENLELNLESAVQNSPFSSQPNLITESSVHPSFYPNSHHQIIFVKFNLEILFPPPYFRDVRHYQDANTDVIRGAIDMFNWDRPFVNTNVNEKVFILNKTILNILSNFIPRKTLTVNDKEPPRFTKKIKKFIQENNNVHKSYRNSKINNNIQYLR